MVQANVTSNGKYWDFPILLAYHTVNFISLTLLPL